ncbi:group-specific protein [Acutalibacter sp. 1XD8-33]|uniref:nucleoside 2-deoxyribosyltransferase n=1 Tax=Acutalibacter sp. 1XD8-33 TaxID=2320081 RepID=UPI000EA02B14|nr:nucleoside 2-deoxyribosyltransferase [Acutalibacter sp. 1XD8-33]RKJ40593.1 group-specific protein [Acutalibacter sp. 1XD8-33]
MTFYIGSCLGNRETVSWFARRLREQGWEQTYDWTRIPPEAVTPEHLKEIARLEERAIREADVVVILLPGGRGTHVELGMALALGKRVYLCAAGAEAFAPESAVGFYHLPGVVRLTGTDEENLSHILPEERG